MRSLKIVLGVLLGVFILLNVGIMVTGKTYLYKGLANTYLVGRSGPSINEDHIFSSRVVGSRNPDPWPLHSRYERTSLKAAEVDSLRSIGTVSFLIVQHDSLLLEQYWEGYNPDSLTNSFSVAKSIVSILTGIALDEERLQSLDQKVGEFLPSFSKGEKARISLRHLLTMSSGTNWEESGADPFSHNAQAYYGRHLKRLIRSLTVVEPPGQRFNYQSGNTQIMGAVLEKATGMRLSEYAEQKLWQPLEATHDAKWNLDRKNGDEKAFCCYYASVRDFARVGQLYLDSGRWNGEQVVPASYVWESVTPAVLGGKEVPYYGYFWWLEEYKGREIFYARGILGQYIIVVPSRDMVIVRAGHERKPRNARSHPKDLYLYLDIAWNHTRGRAARTEQ